MPRIVSIPASKLRKIFEKDGFGVMRPIVIPDWPAVPVFIIRNNIRTAGISRERYFQLLEEIN